MAVKHPVAGITGDEFHIARLCDADEDSIARAPGGFGLAAAFGAGDDKLMTVKVDGMVVHAEIDQADADAFAMAHD